MTSRNGQIDTWERMTPHAPRRLSAPPWQFVATENSSAVLRAPRTMSNRRLHLGHDLGPGRLQVGQQGAGPVDAVAVDSERF